jgi:hypothetical protein
MRSIKRDLAFAAALMELVCAWEAKAGPAEMPGGSHIELTPHHAVYQLLLERSNPGSNVADVKGDLTYDFKGSSCEGYTLSTRLVTTLYDRDGKTTVQDIRSESYEKADGSVYRFNTSQYLDDKLADATKGKAMRTSPLSGEVEVDLDKPKRSSKTLSGDIIFPTQHSIEVLKAAATGKSHFQADLYDGSEKGIKVYETTTMIGSAMDPASNLELPQVKNSDQLNEVVSWPVLVSYYDDTQNKDGVPTYEISFRMYANGVSRKLKLNYGVFALTGDLTSIEFFPGKPCPADQPLKALSSAKIKN